MADALHTAVFNMTHTHTTTVVRIHLSGSHNRAAWASATANQCPRFDSCKFSNAIGILFVNCEAAVRNIFRGVPRHFLEHLRHFLPLAFVAARRLKARNLRVSCRYHIGRHLCIYVSIHFNANDQNTSTDKRSGAMLVSYIGVSREPLPIRTLKSVPC
jgi:hypothetical protein